VRARRGRVRASARAAFAAFATEKDATNVSIV
jgi:hypothetical protein